MTGEPRPGPTAPSLRSIPGRLWTALAQSRRRLLLLDYDGTLSDLVAERDRAAPRADSIRLLQRICLEPSCGVAIVSGRPVFELRALLGQPPFALIGEHGWESLEPGGEVRRLPLSPAVAERLETAAATLRLRVSTERIERKRTAVALHVRGLPGAEARRLTDIANAVWAPLCVPGQLEVRPFRAGFEFRALGQDKGRAVQELLAREAAGAFAVFVGDDATDEDAFDAVRATGFGIRVGPADEPTLATAWLDDPEAVTEFLAEWWRTVAASRPSGPG
jgi:trehalose-phosphatase